MRKICKILLTVLICMPLVQLPHVYADEYVIAAVTEDTYISESITEPKGYAKPLVLKGTQNYMLIKFEISESNAQLLNDPNTNCKKAVLVLTRKNLASGAPSPKKVNVYAIDSNWAGSELVWNEADTYREAVTGTAVASRSIRNSDGSPRVKYEFDLTGMINGAGVYSVLLKSMASDVLVLQFASLESSGAADRPAVYIKDFEEEDDSGYKGDEYSEPIVVPGNNEALPAALQFSENEKELQRTDGRELLTQINAAVKAGGNIDLLLTKAHYRFEKNDNLKPFIHIYGAQDVTIDGQDATFWFEDARSGMLIEECEDVTIKNLKFDYDPLPYTQGTIVKINKAGGYLDLELDPGFLTYDNAAMDPRDGSSAPLSIFFYDSAGKYKRKTDALDVNMAISEDSNKDNTCRIYPVNKDGRFSIMDVGVNDLAVLKRRMTGTQVVKVDATSSVYMEKLHVYAAPFTAFPINNTDGNVTIKDCCIEPLPGTERLMASNADSINVRNTRGEVSITGCRVDGAGDDMIIVYGHYSVLVKREGSEYLFRASENDNQQMFKPGEYIDFYSLGEDYEHLGRTRVVSCVESPQDYDELEYLLNQEERKRGIETLFDKIPGGKAYRVVFEDDLVIPDFSLAQSEGRTADKITIEQNILSNGTNAAIRARGDKVYIRNNTIDHIHRNGITLDLDLPFFNCGTAASGEISGNTIMDTNIAVKPSRENLFPGAIASAIVRKDQIYFGEGPIYEQTPIKNMIISNNRIINAGGYGMFLLNTDGFTVIGNTFENVCSLDLDIESKPWGLGIPDSAVYIAAGKNMVLADNEVVAPGAYYENLYKFGSYTDDDSIFAKEAE